MDEKFTPADAARAQIQFCTQNEMPCFAPYDGLCPHCRHSIYEPVPGREGRVSEGYTLEYAGHNLITGCPHCNYSFVE